MRMGLQTGEVVGEAQEFLHKYVIPAAHVAAHAEGGQILVSSLLRELTERSGEFTFHQVHGVELEGPSGPHPVFEVRWQDQK